ncbi:hypothetical protein EJ04DRAFT_426209 [Polyplosphaeria fusca]|uniref:Uncharacterized protein n=1 Tax=Polyplosphaeria fusca TaxID=682080 RepID=A0A9P4R5Q2_9PLEO|nr:hypothetical protein EJ04DRAFT_426209 [Polyplosphaeria fusca]
MGDGAQDTTFHLAEQLTEGFAALSGEYQLLFDHQKQLETKLSWAKQQYLDVLKRFSPDTLSQDHLVFLHDLENVAAEAQPHTPLGWLEPLSRSENEDRRRTAALIQQAEAASTKLHAVSSRDHGVKIWNGPSADQPDRSHLERDFTTLGMPSKLSCPFSSGGRQSALTTPRSSTSRTSRGSLRGRRSKRPSFNDPIRAEICGNMSAVSGSGDGSAAVCPIRFLDQHAPEEVAQYFENHKHEIPRSHEVCIKRFQSNAESIQQLDRKYGNLVSMIQGLGEKHQAWLPKDPEEDEEARSEPIRPERKVENWAKAVSASLHNSTPDEDTPGNELDEARTAHFDRPLKEVRLGESPSRPWGIAIPAKYTNAESSSSVGSPPTAPPPVATEHQTQNKQPGKCPFDHLAMGKGKQVYPDADAEGPPPPKDSPAPVSPEAEARKPSKPEMDSAKVVPQMVFNGPVFLGYPADQLSTLLQNSNIGGMMR